MKRLMILIIVLLIGEYLISGTVGQWMGISKRGEEVRPTLSEIKGPGLTMNPNFGKVPLYFIPNKGQVSKKAKFYAKTPHYTLWMTGEGLVFDSIRKVENKAIQPTPAEQRSQKGVKERDVSRLVFINANKNAEILPIEITQHKVNYYIGNDPAKWQKGISTSRAVLYKEIYNNIDLKVYGNESQIEYDWIVKPGGNPDNIRIEYINVNGTRIDEQGNLLIKTKFGELLHKKPVSFQLINGNKVKVESNFQRVDKNVYGFKVNKFSRDYDLIIDPVVSLDYSTYLGGDGEDHGFEITVDSEGYFYVTGETDSLFNFPTQNAYQYVTEGYYDVFVTKFNQNGSGLIYSTYLGGSQEDTGLDIEIFSNGSAYIAGYTNSSDFPTINLNRIKGDYNAFVARFDSSGNFMGSYTLGGGGDDIGCAISEDSSGYVFIAGYTESSDFPTLNPFNNNTTLHHTCGFVCKIYPGLAGLKFSTYLGGFFHDYTRDIVLDNRDFIYVVGYTGADENDFPLKNAYQTESNPNKNNAFLCKFYPDGSDLVYATFLGGSGDDYGHNVAVDQSGSAYVVGWTDSMDFPTKDAYQGYNAGNIDSFITKFTPDGSDLVYSTYLGGISTDRIFGLAVDFSYQVYLSGTTGSVDFPIKDQYQTYTGSSEIFVSLLNASGTDLVFSTFLGNEKYDSGRGLAIDCSNNIYITGYTENLNFPTKNPYQSIHKKLIGIHEAIVSKFSFTYDLIVQSTPDTGVPITVIPSDYNGKTDGETNFTRNYDPGTLVTLTAPDVFNDRLFCRWAIDGNDVFTRSIQVTMNSVQTVTAVYQAPGELSINRSRLYFGASAAIEATSEQTFLVGNSGESTLNWTISDDSSWLSCSPVSGTDSGIVTVTVDASGLSAGTYNGTITVNAPYAPNSPQYVYVTLVVYSANKTGVPFGYFETPKEGAHVYSSIPVTGWTLDDIEVENVKIYREQGKQLVYIGDAVFVEGARPDVELAYPAYPKSYWAGWGYMLLTNFFPDGGNGTFKLYAIARDKEGHQVTLGIKTIHCDNANAVKPFGAIDTPDQGGSALGINYRNQGWVLTPLPNKIPEDGHTVIVWIDGLDVGKCKYNIYRSDIATLFPGYKNSNGAMAYFDFDTTTYKNGVHTIQWTAMDNAGNVDGIGSRYFTVKNTGGSTAGINMAKSTELKASVFGAEPSMFNFNLSEVPLDVANHIRVKKGYCQKIKPHKRLPDESGKITIEIKELERVEIDLGSPANWRGFQIVGNRLRSLPIGSFFDTQKGIFTWMPGPGFMGTFRFVFLKEKENREVYKILLNINVLPKFTGK